MACGDGGREHHVERPPAWLRGRRPRRGRAHQRAAAAGLRLFKALAPKGCRARTSLRLAPSNTLGLRRDLSHDPGEGKNPMEAVWLPGQQPLILAPAVEVAQCTAWAIT